MTILLLRVISISILFAVSFGTLNDIYSLVADQKLSLESRLIKDIESGENGESNEQKKVNDDDEKYILFSKFKSKNQFITFDYIFKHTDEIQSKSFKPTLIQPPDQI